MKNKFTQKAAALLCSKKALNRARTAHRLLSMTAIIACLAVVPAFADNEALNAVNNRVFRDYASDRGAQSDV